MTGVSWALADAGFTNAEKEVGQTESCAGFFANLCSFDSDRFESLIESSEAPPRPPPPPFPPLGDLVLVNASALLNSGGELQVSSDGSDGTYVTSENSDHPWIGWDLGTQVDDLYAVELVLAHKAPPSPPLSPPPDEPSAPPSNPPIPSPSPSPSPPPPSPPGSPPVACRDVNQDACVIRMVQHARNGVCEDGGVGSVQPALCDFGNDVSDCGLRPCHDPRQWADNGRRLSATLHDRHAEHVEIYVSRSFASFGSRAATVDLSQVPIDGRVMLRLTEGEGSMQLDRAQGRFVFVRAFSDDLPLRVGSLRVYRLSLARRKLAQSVPKSVPEPAPEPAPERPPELNLQHILRTISKLRNTTKASCVAAKNQDYEEARKERTRAAMLWGEVDDSVNSTMNGTLACWDCLLDRPGSCTHFFLWTPAPPSETKLKNRRHLQAEQEKTHRRRSLEELMGKSCCRVHRATGVKDCDPSYCAAAVKQKAHARMAHTLRRLHDAGLREETRLSVVQLVATDLLSPKTAHPHSPCKKGDMQAGATECLAESMIHHALAAHGASREQIDEHMGKVGLTLSGAVARMLGAAQQTTGGAPIWKSDPQRAASAARRSRRRASSIPDPSLGAISLPSRTEREGRVRAASWLNASAKHASALVRAGELHTPPSHVSEKASFSVDVVGRVIASPDSLLGRSVAAGQALAGVLARRPSLKLAPVAPERPHRKLVDAFYNHVDSLETGRRLEDGTTNSGLDLPLHASWLHKVDWPSAVRELHRVSGVLQTRTSHLHAHVRRMDQLPHGPLLERHLTGWALLDVNVPPTAFGNGLRRLHDWLQGRSPDTVADQARNAPRVSESTRESAVAKAILRGEGILSAAQEHLENSNSHHTSRIRKLADGFLGAAQALPVSAREALTPYGKFPASGAGMFTEYVRWFVEDTLLCYLYPPGDGDVVTPVGDGTGIKKHRSNRLCFPAIPFLPQKMPVFREAFGLRDDWRWDSLEYETACSSDAVKSVLASLGEPVPWSAGPYSLVLRAAEGVDALNNIVKMTDDSVHGTERAAALVCGTAQLGGLLFTVMATSLALLLCSCAPIGSATCILCWRTCRQRRGAQIRRDQAVDMVLQRANEEGWLLWPEEGPDVEPTTQPEYIDPLKPETEPALQNSLKVDFTEKRYTSR